MAASAVLLLAVALAACDSKTSATIADNTAPSSAQTSKIHTPEVVESYSTWPVAWLTATRSPAPGCPS